MIASNLRQALWVALFIATGCSHAPDAGTDGAVGGPSDTSSAIDGVVADLCPAYPGAVFCDDFESETPASLLVNFPGPGSSFANNVRPTVQTSAGAYSGTKVLLASAQYTSATNHYSLLSRDLPTVLATQHLRVATSLRIKAGTNLDLQWSMHGTDANSALISLILEVESGTLTADYPFSGSVPYQVGAWVKVELDVTFTPDNATRQAVVTLNGTALPAVHFAIVPADYAGTWAGTMDLGTYGFSGSPDSQVEFDDVVIWQD